MTDNWSSDYFSGESVVFYKRQQTHDEKVNKQKSQIFGLTCQIIGGEIGHNRK